MNVVSSTADYTRDHSQGQHREAKTNYTNFGQTQPQQPSHGQPGLKSRPDPHSSSNPGGDKNRQNISDNHDPNALHSRGLSRQSKNSSNMDTKKKRILRTVRQDKAKSIFLTL